MFKKKPLKEFLGEIPMSAELIRRFRPSANPPEGGYALDKLKAALPGWISQAKEYQQQNENGKKIFIFGMLRYWIEHTTLMSITLAARGHDVTLGYLPYQHWKKEVSRFDTRRQSLFIEDVLQPAKELIAIQPLFGKNGKTPLPDDVESIMHDKAYRDVQYSLLREEVDVNSDLYQLRSDRNVEFANRLLDYLKSNRPDAVIVPNGSILEFGMVFLIAKHLEITVMTYEFGEQSGRMWLAQDDDIMRQNTHSMWESVKETPLTEREFKKVQSLFATRQGGGLWNNFARRWQGTPNKGGEQAKIDLGLDDRPIVLLPSNVLGDSLTLGRQMFSSSMTEWLTRTIEFFKERDDVQFIIRVHPGEQIGWGPSVYDILTEKFPSLPDHIHLLPADADVNTYDLVNAADLGLVFTTTVGMEMAMSGLPVIVTGETHYRGKGFTHDPDSWDAYFEMLEDIIMNPSDHRPDDQDVHMAWTYAYRFFFDYPQPYPWHVQHFWQDANEVEIKDVLSGDGLIKFGSTLDYLSGEPISWLA